MNETGLASGYVSDDLRPGAEETVPVPTTSPGCTEMADGNNSVIFHVSHYIINLPNCV